MPSDALARPPLTLPYRKLVDGAAAVFVFCGAIQLIEPSPYDFASLIAMPLWFFGGFKINRRLIPYLVLVLIYNLAGFLALVPYWNEADPRAFMLQSAYLCVTTIFFAAFFNERATIRADLILWAFVGSCIVAGGSGIVGYFDIGGTGQTLATYGRAAGLFKDPNVLGSYLILGALTCMQGLLIGTVRRRFLVACALLIILGGIFLSFSRGSWLAFAAASALMVGFSFVTTGDARLRRRILIGTLALMAAVVLLVIIALSIDSIHQLLLSRTQGVGEEYDDRRFANQLASLPMLLDLPNGFGPLRFRLFFGLEPHSSYVNGFASYGWLGGFTFLLLVGVTTVVGFRLALKASPMRRYAQVFWPALLVFLLQGFQIDIDHWRHVWMMFGAIWGLEAARARWASQQPAEAAPAQERARQPALAMR